MRRRLFKLASLFLVRKRHGPSTPPVTENLTFDADTLLFDGIQLTFTPA